jgi:hypothetical protein
MDPKRSFRGYGLGHSHGLSWKTAVFWDISSSPMGM